jgi:hypothetical protein
VECTVRNIRDVCGVCDVRETPPTYLQWHGHDECRAGLEGNEDHCRAEAPAQEDDWTPAAAGRLYRLEHQCMYVEAEKRQQNKKDPLTAKSKF